MTKFCWLLAIVSALVTTAFILSTSFTEGTNHSKSVPVVRRYVPEQKNSVVREQEQFGQNSEFAQPVGQVGNFQGVSGSFTGGSPLGGLCGSLGAIGDSQPK